MKCPKCGKYIEHVNMKFLSKSGKTLIRVWYCKNCDAYWKEFKYLRSIAKYKKGSKQK